MPLKFDDVKKLHQKKYRYELGYFLVEGEHLILELHKAAQLNSTLKNSQLFVTERYQDFASPFAKTVISEKNMAQLSDTKTPQGIIAVVPLLDSPMAGVYQERAIYLHEIQDPGNLGTILRSLAWFGGFRCLLSPNSVDPFNLKVVRASMGAIFHAPIERDVSLWDVNERFEHIAYLDMNGTSIADPSFNSHTCFMFGNEARGIPRDQLITLDAPKPFTILGSGTIESLNLGIAVSLCAFELAR
jgi:TrmH family RNA methyltransferase